MEMEFQTVMLYVLFHSFILDFCISRIDIYNESEQKMSLFTNKTLMITGGTGSFGNAVLNRFLTTDIGEIRIFSRDEKKQDC